LLKELNRTELAELMEGRKVLDRALLVLRAAQHHDIDSMSAAEVAAVLTEKFRETTKRAAVRIAIERARSYTDRRRRSDGTVVYALMAPGERYLKGLAEGDDNEKPDESTSRSPKKRARTTTARKPRRTKAEAASPAPATKKETSSGDGVAKPVAKGTPRRKASGRPGPKAILEELLGQGHFSTPQTMGALIDHIERKHGYRYKSTDFGSTLARLLREKKLDRDRNKDGRYEYRKHGSS
jgi:hypothetical protein